MAGGPRIETQVDGHGDVFARDMGAMIVHVQRESGLAHRTFVFRAWQVQMARAIANKWTWAIAGLAVVSWAFFAVQAVRVPLLNTRIAKMEHDALRVDTLQQTLKDLQARYEQVQTLLSRPAQSTAVPKQAPDPRP
jgi:hypothetical protein